MALEKILDFSNCSTLSKYFCCIENVQLLVTIWTTKKKKISSNLFYRINVWGVCVCEKEKRKRRRALLCFCFRHYTKAASKFHNHHETFQRLLSQSFLDLDFKKHKKLNRKFYNYVIVQEHDNNQSGNKKCFIERARRSIKSSAKRLELWVKSRFPKSLIIKPTTHNFGPKIKTRKQWR